MLLNNMIVLFAKIQYNPYNPLITHACSLFQICRVFLTILQYHMTLPYLDFQCMLGTLEGGLHFLRCSRVFSHAPLMFPLVEIVAHFFYVLKTSDK